MTLAPPRYQPSRALPAYAYVPGRTPRPLHAASDATRSEPLPSPAARNEDRWSEDAEYLWGVDLYNAGFFWEAHEVWEGLWREADQAPRRREFLQGLIQCAAACLKAAAGDADACSRLSVRALARLEAITADHAVPYMGLDLAAFVAAFRAFTDAHPTDAEQRPRITLREASHGQ